MLGGISQPRVSQLVKEGHLVAERDTDGRMQYDRASVERLAALRAQKRAVNSDEAEEKRLLQEEGRERFKRDRDRERERERKRTEHLDSLKEREVTALEEIAKALKSEARRM